VTRSCWQRIISLLCKALQEGILLDLRLELQWAAAAIGYVRRVECQGTVVSRSAKSWQAGVAVLAFWSLHVAIVEIQACRSAWYAVMPVLLACVCAFIMARPSWHLVDSHVLMEMHPAQEKAASVEGLACSILSFIGAEKLTSPETAPMRSGATWMYDKHGGLSSTVVNSCARGLPAL
jgi:hypothetical protein